MAKVNLITTENVTPEQLNDFKALLAAPDGSAANPYRISSAADLIALKDRVATSTTDFSVDPPHYLQTCDIDMAGIAWSGIGLKNGDEPDTEHTFYGVYDGGGHSICNLTFAFDTSDGSDNEFYGFFRSCVNSVIKNLTINVRGFDNPTPGKKFGGAAFVGTAANRLDITNCTANGTVGTEDNPCGHTAAGIVAYMGFPIASMTGEKGLFFTDVTNNASVYTTRKAAGMVGFLLGNVSFVNVANTATVMRVGPDNGRPDDGVGALVGWENTGSGDAYLAKYVFDNVANTGNVETNQVASKNFGGQLVGSWGISNAVSSVNIGDVKLMYNAKSLPLASNWQSSTTNGPASGNSPVEALSCSFGEIKSDGYCHVVKTLKNGGHYVWLFSNVTSAGYSYTPKPYVLPDGFTVYVNQRFGAPKIVGPDGKQIAGNRIGNTDEYIYTVGGGDFPDPASITDTCTVGIPSNIVDGIMVTGTTLDAATGSMTVTEKRVTQFQAKFSPGKHVEAADTISPVIIFNRCVIATELEFYGDCAASGKPITIVFNNCVFDGSGHRKQFLFLQYGEKYSTDGRQISVVDSTAVAKYNVILNNVKFINLDPDKDTRALFKGFGSTLDRPDLAAGAHFDPSENALSAQTILADQDAAALVAGIDGADKGYKAGAQYEYHKFQAGSYGTVTNI